MPIPLAEIEALAPDQGSLDSARKLLKPNGWPTLGGDGEALIWGECQGSGASPYRVIVSEPDRGYKCTCPSRKFPCKHSLALMWLRADGKAAFSTGAPPDWVNDWLGRRRGPGARPDPKPEGAAPRPSMAASAQEAPETVDPKAEARAAAQRERNRLERESAILDGLDQLDLWLQDQLARGFSAFQGAAAEQCRTLAKRLVDAKAGGLATRIEALASELFAIAQAERGDFLLEAFAQLHLLAEAYRRQDGLAPELRADVRQAVGWTVSREALLADPLAPRVRGTWSVLAAMSEVQPDKLRRNETWLGRVDDGAGPSFALLIDFIPVSVGATGPAHALGERFEAELAFYPSPAPLRAIVAERLPLTAAADWTPAGGMAAAFGAYETALAAKPWLGDWPFALNGARVRGAGAALYLVDAAGGSGLRLKTGEADSERALLAASDISAFGLWSGRDLRLLYAKTDLGEWTP